MKNSQAPSSRMPAITTTGWIGVRFCCSQWKYECPVGLKVRKTIASENTTRMTTLPMSNSSLFPFAIFLFSLF